MQFEDFNANDYENDRREVLPMGNYRVVATKAEEKPTKAGNGSYLEIEYEVLEGDFKGRRVWDRLNLKNPSTQAVEIARRTLASICKAIGVNTPRSSSELLNVPLVVRIGVESRGDFGPSNSIRGYSPASVQPAAPQPQAQQVQQEGGKPAWMN